MFTRKHLAQANHANAIPSHDLNNRIVRVFGDDEVNSSIASSLARLQIVKNQCSSIQQQIKDAFIQLKNEVGKLYSPPQQHCSEEFVISLPFCGKLAKARDNFLDVCRKALSSVNLVTRLAQMNGVFDVYDALQNLLNSDVSDRKLAIRTDISGFISQERQISIITMPHPKICDFYKSIDSLAAHAAGLLQMDMEMATDSFECEYKQLPLLIKEVRDRKMQAETKNGCVIYTPSNKFFIKKWDSLRARIISGNANNWREIAQLLLVSEEAAARDEKWSSERDIPRFAVGSVDIRIIVGMSIISSYLLSSYNLKSSYFPVDGVSRICEVLKLSQPAYISLSP